jgi:hypothetical protein
MTFSGTDIRRQAGFLDTLSDPATRKFAVINYGPWDRLDEIKLCPRSGRKA